MKKKLTQEYLKEALTYNPDTGIFTWNERPENHFKTKRAGRIINTKNRNKEAGYIKDGYLGIGIKNNKYKAHRLAFLYMEGYFPENQVDHIDRDPLNNKWNNLREVSNQCNSQNCKLFKSNTSGVCGVYWSRPLNKWMAAIMISGKSKYLGLFENFEDAVMARYNEEVSNPEWSCSVESTAYKYLKDHNLI